MAKKRKKSKRYRYKYVGRKTKLTPEVVKKLEEAFSVGANVSQACYYANISRQTFYTWMENNPELNDRLEDLKQKLPLQALYNIAARIHGKIPKGDIVDSKWLLEKRMKDEYGDSVKVEHSGNIGDGTPEEDKAIIDEFHQKLISNRLKRSREKAKEDGEL